MCRSRQRTPHPEPGEDAPQPDQESNVRDDMHPDFRQHHRRMEE